MKFVQVVYTKIKDYFTANNGRKIFFLGLVSTLLMFGLYQVLESEFFRIFGLLSLLGAGFGTMWDSMYSRYLFLKKVRDMQYEHLKEIYDKQDAGESVAFTPTFSDEEKKYLRRRKIMFIVVILFKVGLVIALFSLLLHI